MSRREAADPSVARRVTVVNRGQSEIRIGRKGDQPGAEVVIAVGRNELDELTWESVRPHVAGLMAPRETLNGTAPAQLEAY